MGRIGIDLFLATLSPFIERTLCAGFFLHFSFLVRLEGIGFSNYEPVNRDTLSDISLNRTLKFAFFSLFPIKNLPCSSIPDGHAASCDSQHTYQIPRFH